MNHAFHPTTDSHDLANGTPRRLRLASSTRQLEPPFPVSIGIPFARGTVHDPSHLKMVSPCGEDIAFQTRVTSRWSDGSVRWLLCTWIHSSKENHEYRLIVPRGIRSAPRFAEMNGAATMRLALHSNRLHFRSDIQTLPLSLDVAVAGKTLHPVFTEGQTLDSGPIYESVVYEFTLRDAAGALVLSGELEADIFPGLRAARCLLTIRNPHRAAHPGGIWVLGDAGSIMLDRLHLGIAIRDVRSIDLSPEPHLPPLRAQKKAALYQESSGGANWRSRNHVSRDGTVPMTFCGYRCDIDGEATDGKRAAPLVIAHSSLDTEIAIGHPVFWQEFPRGIEVDAQGITLQLLPDVFPCPHELQGGEQKTFEWWLSVSSELRSLAACEWQRSSRVVTLDPTEILDTCAVPYFIGRDEESDERYEQLVDSAIEGPRSFACKREQVDEYGWRHFGDIYGDHEAAFSAPDPPLLSHYNNQYDAVAGFAIQFLRTADERWWHELQALARHVVDIDIYHTDEDKSAYNHGQFWHTVHYVDAGASTHRSYPRHPSVCGGGPSAEQAYAHGLCLHYYLTGSRQSYRAVLELADWIMAMEDGRRTVFRFLARGDTGLSTCSGNPDYHGPGRGSANSVQVLCDAFLLSRDRQYLARATQLIRRVVHPDDDVAVHNLLDVERKWFYTMFLQSLGSYLDIKTELGEDSDHDYWYARLSLLRYVTWMVENEAPYLHNPDILEYPTETWVAQDMRKVEAFLFGAKYALGPERDRFLERAQYFYEYCLSTLPSLPTHHFCRPTVLMLRHGYMYNAVRRLGLPSADSVSLHTVFPPKRPFVPQKRVAIRRARSVASVLVATIAFAAVCGLSYWIVGH